MSENCLICNTELTYHGSKDLMKNFICPVCGSYDMNVLMVDRFTQNATTYDDIKPKLCSKIYYHNLYHHKPYFIDYEDLETLKTENTSPAQILNRLIEFLYQDQHELDSFRYPTADLFPILQSFNVHVHINYFKELESQNIVQDFQRIQLSPERFVGIRTFQGFEAYEELKKGKSKSNQVFMALQFDSDADKFYKDHLKSAVEKLGLELKDLRELSKAGKLTSQMEAEIRQSKLIIADITPVKKKPNANVYWEAGFAQGLGKPVIYMADKKSSKTKLPFDTGSHLHVFYDASSPEGRAEAIADLQAKIFNTFPNELILPDNKEKP